MLGRHGADGWRRGHARRRRSRGGESRRSASTVSGPVRSGTAGGLGVWAIVGTSIRIGRSSSCCCCSGLPLLLLSRTLALVHSRCEAAGNLRHCTGGGGDSDQALGVALRPITLDAVSGRQERVKALNKRRMSAEEGRDAVNDARSVDAGTVSFASVENRLRSRGTSDSPRRSMHVHLAFELFHDIEEAVIHFWLIGELDLLEEEEKHTQCQHCRNM